MSLAFNLFIDEHEELLEQHNNFGCQNHYRVTGKPKSHGAKFKAGDNAIIDFVTYKNGNPKNDFSQIKNENTEIKMSKFQNQNVKIVKGENEKSEIKIEDSQSFAKDYAHAYMQLLNS